MFYCDPCRVENTWPESFGKSYGPCEVCKQHAVCNDRPAATLPIVNIIDDTSFWW
jgi:hypothetical protein